MTAGKIIVSLVSLLLVVGVVCGVITVANSHEEEKKEYKVSSSMKAVTTICEPTEFKDACVRSLQSAARNESANLKDFVLAAIDATTEEVKNALEVAKKQSIDKQKYPYDHMGVEDCKQLLKEGIDNLQASFSMVGETELRTLNNPVRELVNWIYAVYSFEIQCVDYVDNPEYKSALQDGMLNATQLTNNVLTIVHKIREYLRAFNVKIDQDHNASVGVVNHLNDLTDTATNINNHRRRLLLHDDDDDQFPTWLSPKDRKLLSSRPPVGPDAVVSKDGSGEFKTIGQAINAYPKNHRGRYTIYVKAGVYKEIVRITNKQPNIYIYGDGVGKTIITGNKNFGLMKINTMNTATFACDAPGFIARGLTIQNTAGPAGHQAVALRMKGDMSVVFDCSIEGYQDTLYYHQYRQFYRNCVISGTIDFLFGEGAAVIQNSLIVVRRPGPKQNINTVTADGRQKKEAVTGLVLQNCRIVPERELFGDRFRVSTYLGRPWKMFANTIVMQSELGDFIRPEGYLAWDGANHDATCSYFEFGNKGPGATFNRRVRWKGVRLVTPREAAQYTPDLFLVAPAWLRHTGAPFQPGL